MVLLLLMTVVSLTTLKAIKTDERLAGNLQDRNTALQAAESALREAEEFLQTVPWSHSPTIRGFILYTYSGIPAPLRLTDEQCHNLSGIPDRGRRRPLLYPRADGGGGGKRYRAWSSAARYGGERRATYRISALGFGGLSYNASGPAEHLQALAQFDQRASSSPKNGDRGPRPQRR